ncbi:MAG TPA: response regulator [Rhodanobacteraceae bacterium]|nr:response regulator [Rhodanobacteraceae bacterium]
MASQMSQPNPDAELQTAFRQHLPRRLKTLLRRARAQCRTGWDCNVMRSLHDEVALLAGACGRYGLLETGERLLALESALAPTVQSGQLPDPAVTAEVDALLDTLRPHLQHLAPVSTPPAWLRDDGAALAARGPFPRCEMPPAGYAAMLGINDSAPDPEAVASAPEAANEAPAAQPRVAGALGVDAARGPRVRIVNDDDPLVNELLLRLDQQGCDVALVDNLDGMLELIQRDPPELAVLVADMDTRFDVLAIALRAARAQPGSQLKLLALLRGPDVELRLRALRLGADRCIALPATSEEVLNAARELAEVEQDSPYRVLIVDDDAAQSLFAQAILKRAGMETRVLSESLPVLEELDRFQPDLLLLDLNMPDCDGFELTALIREREGYVNTPIVFLSGELDEDRQFAALDAGGDDFLIKPIRPAHLIAAVTNRVRRARSAATRTRRRRRRDAATGLHERAQLLDALSEHLAASGGFAARGGLVAVELRDSNNLRALGDLTQFDQLLTQVGEFIVARAPGGSMTARYGQIGFLVFAPMLERAGLVALATELARTVEDHRFGTRATVLHLDCAVCAFDAATSESAVALAAVERALASSRNHPGRIVVQSGSDEAPGALEERIAAALATESFDLAFQPVIPIRGAAQRLYQALLRLRSNEREYLAAELVPAATRAGNIAAVDMWVVGRCISILARHRQTGDQVALIASQSLQGWDDMARRAALSAKLAAAGIPADALVLEFRCEAARANPRALVELVPALKRIGLRLSLAGVDRSAVAAGWLELLAFDFIKLQPDLPDAELADVVQVAHQHGRRVIAPRIETVARAERLREAEVDLLQGNYFRPPAAAMEPMSRQGAT